MSCAGSCRQVLAAAIFGLLVLSFDAEANQGFGNVPVKAQSGAALATALPKGSPAAINGQLSVCGTKLCNQHGKPIQLRGMSSHGLQWFRNCVSNRALKALANDWKADVIRLSMYIQEGGYATNPAKFTKLMHELIEQATKRGLYVIVDWHMLEPGDPHENLGRAKFFFAKIARRHRNKTNILYELANEPNGDAVTWSRIKDYHEKIIPVIRKWDANGIILLGTRAWSSLGVSAGGDESEVIKNPVNADNVMYTFHFYAASHGIIHRRALSRAARKIPMFVTEFGTQTYSGDGKNNFKASQRYVNLMARKKISWVNWNLSDDHRSGAVFKAGTCAKGKFAGAKRLKPAGRWIRARIRTPDHFPKQ